MLLWVLVSYAHAWVYAGDFYGAPNETFSINLMDYVQGYDLSFSTNHGIVVDEFNIEELSTLALGNVTQDTTLVQAGSRKLPNVVSSTGEIITISYNENSIYFTAFEHYTLSLVSTLDITTTLSNPQIQDVIVLPGTTYLYLAMSGESASIAETVFYLVSFDDINDPKLIKASSFNINIGINWLRMAASNNYLVVTGYIDVFYPQQSCLLVVSIKSPFTPTLDQFLIGTTYPTAYAADVMFKDNSTFYLAGHDMNFYSYSIHGSQLTLDRLVPFNALPKLSSMSIDGDRILICSQYSLAVLDSETLNILYFAPYSQGNATTYTKVNCKLLGNYAFVNAYTSFTADFLIFDFSQTPNSYMVSSWDMTDVLSVPIDPNAPFEIILSNDIPVLIRNDRNFTSACAVIVGEKLIYVTAGRFEYLADVSVLSKNIPGYSSLIRFSVASTYEFKGAPAGLVDRQKVDNSYTISIDLQNYQQVDVLFYPNNVVEGSNLTFSATSGGFGQLNVTTTMPAKYLNITLDQPTSQEYIHSSGDYLILQRPEYARICQYNATKLNCTRTLGTKVGSLVEASSTLSAGYMPGSYSIDYFCTKGSRIELSRNTTEDYIQMKVVWEVLFMGAPSQIDIYDSSSGYLRLLVSLNSSNTQDIDSFQIVDFAVRVGTINIYLFIVDSKFGLLMVEVPINYLPEVYSTVIFGSSSGIERAFINADFVYFLQTDGTVQVYGFDFQLIPTFEKQLPGKGPWLRASSSSSIFAVQYLNFTDIIDLYNDAYSAFYTSIPTSPSLSIATPDDSIGGQMYLFTELNVQGSISALQIIADKSNYNSPLLYSFYINVTLFENATDFNLLQGYVDLTVSNTHGTSLIFLLIVAEARLYTIKVDDSWANNFTTELQYNDMNVIDISKIFDGQDLSFDLRINGQLASTGDTSHDPAVINHKLKVVREFSSLYADFSDLSVCQQCGLSVVTSVNGLYVFENNIHNNTSYFLKYSDWDDSIVSCNLVESYPSKDLEVMHMLVTCQSMYYDFYASFSQKVLSPILYTLNFNLRTRTFGSGVYTSTPITFLPMFLKYFDLTNDGLIFSLSENYASKVEAFTNNIIEAENTCYYGPNCNEGANIKVNLQFLNFNIANMSVSALDVFFYNNERVLYVADSSYGLRIFNATVLNETVLVNSYKFDEPVVSVGVCNQFLYVGTEDETIYQNCIDNPYDLGGFQYYFYKLGNRRGARGNIKCSSGYFPQYVGVPLYDERGNFIVRILDYNQFDIFAEIEMGDSASFEFINDSTLSVVSGNSKTDFIIAAPKLTFPSMDKNQYQDMLAKWQTNIFTLSIVASDGSNTSQTKLFYLQRTMPDDTNLIEDFSFKIGLAIGGVALAVLA